MRAAVAVAVGALLCFLPGCTQPAERAPSHDGDGGPAGGPDEPAAVASAPILMLELTGNITHEPFFVHTTHCDPAVAAWLDVANRTVRVGPLDEPVPTVLLWQKPAYSGFKDFAEVTCIDPMLRPLPTPSPSTIAAVNVTLAGGAVVVEGTPMQVGDRVRIQRTGSTRDGTWTADLQATLSDGWTLQRSTSHVGEMLAWQG